MNDINYNHRVGGSTVIHKNISITLCSEGRKTVMEKEILQKKSFLKWFLETTHGTIWRMLFCFPTWSRRGER